jgi:hypothetical protein
MMKQYSFVSSFLMAAGAVTVCLLAAPAPAQAQGWPDTSAPAAKPADVVAPAKPAKKSASPATAAPAAKAEAKAKAEPKAAIKPESKPAAAKAEAVAKPAPAPAVAPAPMVSSDLADALQRQNDVLAKLAAELQTQRAVIVEQQDKIKALEARPAASAAPAAALASAPVAMPAPASVLVPVAAPAPPPQPSPLSLKVGDAELLLGGFMDATAVTRSTNHGTGLGTSFGTIPFANTPQGGLSETRLSTQNSRITLQATSKVGKSSLKGYIEADFLGAGPANLNVTSNANTLRMRLYWAQFSTGKFEFLGGQSWSLLTPGRNGISGAPGDLFFGQTVDTNYQLGLTWGRTTQFRFVTKPSEHWTAAVSFENPQQYVGSAVVLPAAFPAAEVDATGNTAAPNAYPDVIGKLAFDPVVGGRHQHVDAAMLVRGFKTYNPAADASYSATGTGVALNAVIEPVKNLRVIANSFTSNGGGRYIANTNGPDFIVNADQSISEVKARSFIVGPEFQVGAKTQIYAYRSMALFDQALALDTNGKAIGYGVPGSTAANHSEQESTIGITRTFFRDPRIGGVQLMMQYSMVERTPFSVPAGTPASAKVNMFYINVRYVLP